MADQSSDAEAYVDARRGIDWLANRPGTPSRRYRHLERLAQMAALVMEFPLLDETDRRRCSGQEPRSHPRRRGDDRHGRAGWRDHRRRSDRGSARAHRTAQPALNRSTAITVARTLATARGTAACAEHVRDASDAPVPSRDPGQMPIGVEIIAAPWWETDALRIAWELEQHGVIAAMRMDCRD
jgi:Asp-tRNA(Asn)/Glu-tRNA(Gln) amidotransferase A subunit family amidase